MTQAEARLRIVTFGCTEDDPTLSAGEIDMLLDMARRPDWNHVAPTDTGWEPTYDWNYAVSQAWLIKSGRLARAYLFMTGGKMLSRQQFYQHCMEMHRKYASRSDLKSVRLSPEMAMDVRSIELA